MMQIRTSARKFQQFLVDAWRRLRLSFDVQYVSGLISIHTQPNDVVVACLVKNGRAYVDEFVKHYKDLGVRHIFVLDNGSTDGTVERFSAHECVSVWKTGMPFKTYKNIMRDLLADRFGGKCWVLYVDIDELFRFPGDDRINLPQLVSYLTDNGHDAIVAHMIDMFPDGPLQEAGHLDWKSSHCWFDVESLEPQDYATWYGPGNIVSNEKIPYYLGGSRAKAFGARQWLSKHPLFNAGKGIRISHAHHVFGANIADISAILLHYKYVGDFQEYFKMVVSEGSFWNGSSYYRQYLAALDDNPNMSLMTPTARKFESLDSLSDAGMICVSEKYSRFLADKEQRVEGQEIQ